MAHVASPGGEFEVVTGDLPVPGPQEVRIRVEAAGVCRTDAMFVAGAFPGVGFPLVPGHEIAGRVEALGDAVQGRAVGDRVVVGWFGGECGRCRACRSGDLMMCPDLLVPGWSMRGGYASHVVVPERALARVPDGLGLVEAAPMGCAGVTAFNALRHSGARPGDTVAVLGLGGVGHLAAQFAARSGMRTVVLARGAEKGVLARELGAHSYIDTTTGSPAEELGRLGGAQVIIAAAASAPAASALLRGLAPRGRLVVVGVDAEPLTVPTAPLVAAGQVVQGHPAGTAADAEEAMRFAVLHGVRPMVETAALTEVSEAFARMLTGRARLRMVLTPDGDGAPG
ncbi:alcohol dehydrogenase catalytic domain-containing protein [Streptomyces sp. NPDC035033]|uniref:alcohol dehydrogenase catalytic domain-containing protein n=1 Tax=Streptomyces sp. NPDC035033 TaxID=3155368 RepID=UPI0033D63E61